jgi:hypothetical protein
MSDIRERHVRIERRPEPDIDARGDVVRDADHTLICSSDRRKWPCDAIREADEKDVLQVLLNGANERAALLLAAKNEWMDRADKAEAALAECRGWYVEQSIQLSDCVGDKEEARADAKALAEALTRCPDALMSSVSEDSGQRNLYRWWQEEAAPALAAHEAMK